MSRSVPLWAFLLFCLVSLCFVVIFSWAVRSTVQGNDRSGVFGRAAVKISDFPNTAISSINELIDLASGTSEAKTLLVPRDNDVDLSDFVPIEASEPDLLSGVLINADREQMAQGWRFVLGAFNFEGKIENAGLLLSPDLKVVKTWILDEIAIESFKPRTKYRKFVHGVDLLPDGSLIFSFDGGVSLQRFDSCGARQWATAGAFHHAVTLDDKKQTIWTLMGTRILQMAVDDGSVMKEIRTGAVIAENPTIDILEIRRVHSNDDTGNTRNSKDPWMKDPFHFNDVDPLPAEIADRFPEFEAGDLLISARSLNLVFVMNPETLKIKWWRSGATKRQHDPDWRASGDISILNNRMNRDFSEILLINPSNFNASQAFSGQKNSFYTRIRGKHQWLDDGTLIVSSPQQGRIFEVGADDEVVFELANTYPDDEAKNLIVSEMKWLPTDFFNLELWKCPIGN